MTDRYGVDPLDGPAQFADALRLLGQRVAALESQPVAPQVPLPANFVSAGAASYTTLTGATWQLAVRFILPAVVAHPALRCLVGYQFTGGSTGRLRLVSYIANGPGISSTTSPTIAGVGGPGSSENVDWLHGIPLSVAVDSDQFHAIDIEGIVDTGGGDLRVFEPSLTLMNANQGASDTGVWTAV